MTLSIKKIVCLIIPLLFCFSLSVMRVVLSRDKFFLFLLWNGLLAVIPLILSMVLVYGKLSNKAGIMCLLFLWLLFFPNAPYIITDFVHLRISDRGLHWFDLILLSSYSLTGMFYGFLSLRHVEYCLKTDFRIKKTGIWAGIFLYLASFGIYLGRFLRWNSWDIFFNMHQMLGDVVVRLADPNMHMGPFVFLFGLFLNIFYFSITRCARQIINE